MLAPVDAAVDFDIDWLHAGERAQPPLLSPHARGMNFWPPKAGLSGITGIRSTMSIAGSSTLSTAWRIERRADLLTQRAG